MNTYNAHYNHVLTIIASILILFIVLQPSVASAATTVGPNSPGTSVGTAAGSCSDNTNWNGVGSPGNIGAQDTSYVSISNGNLFDNGDISDELQISDFGFSIPTGAAILGIQAETIVFTDGGSASYRNVTLFTAPGTNVGEDKATGSVPSSDPGSTYTSWGGSSDTWVRAWTPAEVSSSGFGIALCYTATANNTMVDNDHVRISVTYDAAPTLTVSQPDGTGDTIVGGSLYDITYSLEDTDSIVTAEFFYDTDNSGLNGTPISGACAAAAEGTGVTCSWDTTGVPLGSYYVYGTASDGVSTEASDYSSGQITLTANEVIPTVSTNFATNVGASSASLNGVKLAGTGADDHGFAYGTNPTLSTVIATTSLGALSATTTFSSFVAGLDQNTTYYFRAYATNGAGTGFGTIRSFVTGNTSVTKALQLFGGYAIKFLNGKLILYQR